MAAVAGIDGSPSGPEFRADRQVSVRRSGGPRGPTLSARRRCGGGVSAAGGRRPSRRRSCGWQWLRGCPRRRRGPRPAPRRSPRRLRPRRTVVRTTRRTRRATEQIVPLAPGPPPILSPVSTDSDGGHPPRSALGGCQRPYPDGLRQGTAGGDAIGASRTRSAVSRVHTGRAFRDRAARRIARCAEVDRRWTAGQSPPATLLRQPAWSALRGTRRSTWSWTGG